MSTTQSNRTPFRVASSADIGAPAADVYRMIADYRTRHWRIIPPKYFSNLRVETGGYGAGTIITYNLTAFGKTRRVRARITEPEPGRALVETDHDENIATTFVVEPAGASRSKVTIATELPLRSGILGSLERTMARSFLTRVYAAELALLEQQVTLGI
jgi:hypothetical protein